ncbi:MAG: hypothetical protein K8L99_30215, partial [Anaerolineae bacterium]|nr:hypothetical protein [Anaerolineae bacterium]
MDIIVHAGNVITADPTPYHTAVRRAVNEHDILWVNSAGNIGAGYFPGRFSGGGVLGSPLHSFQDPNVVGARNTLLVPVSRQGDIQVTLMWSDPSTSFSLITLGSCNPNDPESFAPIVTDAAEGMLTVRQTIGTDVLQQMGDYTRVPATSALQTCANAPDGIHDNEIHIGVRSDNAETETPFSLYVQGALPAEYDPDIQQSLDPIVLVPGDLPEVLTVGAYDPRTNHMAWYSGRSNSLQYYELNDFDVDYSDDELVKPNLVTYGEILLPSGQQFFGTSAATPLVAGSSILVHGQHTSEDLTLANILEAQAQSCLRGDGAIGRVLPVLALDLEASGSVPCGTYVWESDLSSNYVAGFEPRIVVEQLQSAKNRSESLRLASLARDQLTPDELNRTYPELSALLGIRALQEAYTVEADSVLTQALSSLYSYRIFHHGDGVTSVAFNHDSTKVLTGGVDGTAILWDIETGEAVRVFAGHSDAVNSVAFNSDSSGIITGSADGTARVWNTATGETINILEGHTDSVSDAKFSPDDSHIVTGGMDNSLILWETDTGTAIWTIPVIIEFGTFDGITSVDFNDSGNRVVVGHMSGSALVFDVSDQELIQTFAANSWVNDVEFSKDNTRILTGGGDGEGGGFGSATVWDVETGQQLHRYSEHTFVVNSVAFSDDGTFALTGGEDGNARFWNTEYGTTLAILEAHQVEVTSADITRDGRFLLTGSGDGTARIWTTDDFYRSRFVSAHGGRIDTVAIAPNGHSAATGGPDGLVQLRDLRTGELIAIDLDVRVVSDLEYSPDGEYLLIGTWDGIIIYDLEAMQQVPSFLNNDWVDAIAVDENGTYFASAYLASADGQGIASVWNMTTMERVNQVEIDADSVFDIGFVSGDPQSLLLITENAIVNWDFVANTVTPIYENSDSEVFRAISDSGSLLLYEDERGPQLIN